MPIMKRQSHLMPVSKLNLMSPYSGVSNNNSPTLARQHYRRSSQLLESKAKPLMIGNVSTSYISGSQIVADARRALSSLDMPKKDSRTHNTTKLMQQAASKSIPIRKKARNKPQRLQLVEDTPYERISMHQASVGSRRKTPKRPYESLSKFQRMHSISLKSDGKIVENEP